MGTTGRRTVEHAPSPTGAKYPIEGSGQALACENGWKVRLRFNKRIGNREIAETALAIGAAFGTGPEVWINLQSAYDLHMAGEADPAIAD